MTDVKNNLAVAVSLAQRGWHVFPCHSVDDDACTCKTNCTSPAKHPVTTNGFHGATSDPSAVRNAWEALPWANVGIRTGRASELWVLDLDGEAGIEALRRLEDENGPLPRTPTVRTGSGGRHLYFAYPDDVAVKCGTKLGGHSIDVRGDGGYVLAAGSTNLKGSYEWLIAPDEVAPAEAPSWLLRFVTERRTNSTANRSAEQFAAASEKYDAFEILDLETDPGTTQGNRHNYACRLIGSHLGFGEPPEAVLTKALAWGKRCQPPMDEDELRQIVSHLARNDAAKRPLEPTPVTHSAPWPVLGDEGWNGLAGEVVKAIEPSTEADPVAILIQFLVYFGNVIGRCAHYQVEASRHFTNLFAVLVGQTAKGRKGTSESWVREIFRQVDEKWIANRLLKGASSGEGLIWNVRDPIVKTEAIKQKGVIVDYQQVIEDHGVEDKRLLAQESEFASVLKMARRDGNILSTVVRDAWDYGDLRTMTKNSPARATGAHISISGHITQEELVRSLDNVEGFNGFANRFIWICVKRSKLLPEGGEPVDFSHYTEKLRRSVDFAKTAGLMSRDDETKRLWAQIYTDLAGRTSSGLLGAVTSRAEAQVLRLSMIYALLDRSTVIRVEHMMAAMSLWQYAEDSARYIFGGSTGDPVVDKILAIIRDGPITTKGIYDKTHRRLGADAIGGALDRLSRAGLIRSEQIATGGRPAERWALTRRVGLGGLTAR